MIYKLQPQNADIQSEILRTSQSDENIHRENTLRAMNDRRTRDGGAPDSDAKQTRADVVETIAHIQQQFSDTTTQIDAIQMAHAICFRTYDDLQHRGNKISNFQSEGYGYFTAAERTDKNGNPDGLSIGCGGIFNNGFITAIFAQLMRHDRDASDMMLILSARLVAAHLINATLGDGSTLYETFNDIENGLDKFTARRSRTERVLVQKTEGTFETTMLMALYMMQKQIVFRDKNNSDSNPTTIPDLHQRRTDPSRMELIRMLGELVYRQNHWGAGSFAQDLDTMMRTTDDTDETRFIKKRIELFMRKFVDTDRPDDVDKMLHDLKLK